MIRTVNDSTHDVSPLDAYPPRRIVLSLGSVFAGILIALAVHITLMSLGAAIGLSAFDPADGDQLSRGTGIAAGVYSLIVAVLGMMAGGYVAAELSGAFNRLNATLHGITMWAGATVFAMALLTWGVGSAFFGTIGALGSTVKTAAVATGSASGSTSVNLNSVKAQIVSFAQGQNTTIEELQRNPELIARTSNMLGISEAQTQALVNGTDAEQQQVIDTLKARASQKMTSVAQTSTEVGAVASWLTVLTLIMGGVAAIIGTLIASSELSDYTSYESTPGSGSNVRNRVASTHV